MEKNGLLIAMYVVAIIIEIGLPLTLAFLVTRRGKVSWVIVLTGVLTFIGSQVVHIPLLQIPALLQKMGVNLTLPQSWPIWAYALYLGILAGLCEETARLIGFKILKKKAKGVNSALALGIGHGGLESVIIGFVVAASLIASLIYTANPQLGGASSDATAMVKAQMDIFWSTPWHMPLAGAVERITAVTCHLFMTLLVWKTVTNGKAWGYLAAVLFHTLLDGASVILSQSGFSSWQLEASILPFFVFSLVMILIIWRKEKKNELPVEEAQPEIEAA
jgi:uncharacterized membrane protein YhfC